LRFLLKLKSDTTVIAILVAIKKSRYVLAKSMSVPPTSFLPKWRVAHRNDKQKAWFSCRNNTGKIIIFLFLNLGTVCTKHLTVRHMCKLSFYYSQTMISGKKLVKIKSISRRKTQEKNADLSLFKKLGLRCPKHKYVTFIKHPLARKRYIVNIKIFRMVRHLSTSNWLFYIQILGQRVPEKKQTHIKCIQISNARHRAPHLPV